MNIVEEYLSNLGSSEWMFQDYKMGVFSKMIHHYHGCMGLGLFWEGKSL